MGNITRLAVALLFSSLWVSSLWAQNPLARKPDSPFVGAFAGQVVKLTLNADNTGTLTFEGKGYPVTGKADGTTFSGKFTVGNDQFDFQLTPDGKAMKLSTGGATYALVPQPANPLAGGGNGVPRQPVAPVPSPPASGSAGGVGIAFDTNSKGELIIAKLLPGGPGEKAGLKPGGILRAVGGKDVAGLKPEDVRSLIGGEPGTLVKITLETANEVQEVILQRADLSKLIPAERPAPGPNPGPTGIGPAPQFPGEPIQNAAAPAWMKPGVRVTYWAGSASIASAGQVLVPSDDGDWESKTTGQKFKAVDNPGAGGMGYQQSTIANVVGDTAIVDFKQYLFNVEAKACTTVIVGGSTVSLSQGSEQWIPPQKLAQMQPGNANGVRILRGPYKLGEKTYNAISINTATANGGTRYTYDTETGLMLAYGSAVTGQGGMTPGPHGQSGWAQGNTQMVQILFVGMRQTNLPWTGQRGPAQLGQLKQVDFAGTYTSAVQGAGQVSWPMAMRWDIGKIDEYSMSYRATHKIDYGNNGLPNEPSVSDRGGSLVSVWVDPRALGQLRPGQVLDEDPVTGMKTSVAAVQGGTVTIAEQGAIEASTASYDLQSGMVQGLSLQTQVGLGTTVAQVRRTR